MPFTLCTSWAIITKAGANASSIATASGAILAQFSEEAEAQTIVVGRYDWVTNYASVNANAKLILNDVTSSLAAMKVISYDMSGYTTRGEAQTMLDVLRDNASQGLALLKDQNTDTFIKKV